MARKEDFNERYLPVLGSIISVMLLHLQLVAQFLPRSRELVVREKSAD
jgi:hypothetical protein